MLYFLHGADSRKARKKLRQLLDLAQKKRPEAEIFRLTLENWSEARLEELLISRGLFEGKYTTVLDNLFEKKEVKDSVVSHLKALAESEQVFLEIEARVDIQTLRKIEKVAAQVQEFNKPAGESRDVNIFSVADNLARKDKKGLWISYIDLLSKGAAPEEIHGILFWQVKKLTLSRAKTYNKEELKKMSVALVDMAHRVRRGEGELDVMLEKFILSQPT